MEALIFALALKVAQLDGSSLMSPGSCAKYVVVSRSAAGIEATLKNACSFPVQWSIQCGFGQQQCYGSAVVGVAAGSEKTVHLAPVQVLDGPYHVN